MGTISSDSGRNWTAYAAAIATPASAVVDRDSTKQAAATSAAIAASTAEGSAAPLADQTICSGSTAKIVAAHSAASRSANRSRPSRYVSATDNPIAAAFTAKGIQGRTPNVR